MPTGPCSTCCGFGTEPRRMHGRWGYTGFGHPNEQIIRPFETHGDDPGYLSPSLFRPLRKQRFVPRKTGPNHTLALGNLTCATPKTGLAQSWPIWPRPWLVRGSVLPGLVGHMGITNSKGEVRSTPLVSPAASVYVSPLVAWSITLPLERCSTR